MRRRKCTLCGGKLVNGICQECGLDNRKTDSRYQFKKKEMWDEYDVKQSETETHPSGSGEDQEEEKRWQEKDIQISSMEEVGKQKIEQVLEQEETCQEETEQFSEEESCQKEPEQILPENENSLEEWKRILPENEKQREKLEQILSKNEKQRAKLEQILSEAAKEQKKTEERKKKENRAETWTQEEMGRSMDAKAAEQSSSVQKEKRASGKKGTKTIAVIFLVLFLINTIPALVGGIRQFFQFRKYERTEENDPYARTDAVLKETGAFYENQLVEGEYVVGVHIPEGKYTVELMEGYGGMQVLDSEHDIYIYEFFSEKNEKGKEFITECEDVRLFAGATVKILSPGVQLRFSSENAQLNEMTGIENPLTEQVHLQAEEKLTAGKDFEAGVYNLYYEGETEGEYGTFQWLVPGTVTEEARKERDAYTGSVFVKDQLRELGGLHCCNIVLPEDTLIYAQGVGVRLVPSEMIVSEDYASAYEYIDTEE